MQLRELTHMHGTTTVRAWPPVWAAPHTADEPFPAPDIGSLRLVKRIAGPGGDRLLLVKRVGAKDYVTALRWDEPPTVAAVERLLQRHLGAEIRMLGDLHV